MALTQDKLEQSTLLIKASAKLQSGQLVELPDIKVPTKQDDNFASYQNIERLQHYGQLYGSEAVSDTYDPNDINPAAFFTDDADGNTRLIMELHAKEQV